MIEMTEINERKIFYIDVGNISKEECERIINEVAIAMKDIRPSVYKITLDNSNK